MLITSTLLSTCANSINLLVILPYIGQLFAKSLPKLCKQFDSSTKFTLTFLNNVMHFAKRPDVWPTFATFIKTNSKLNMFGD